jgi:thioester reductase-like protein
MSGYGLASCVPNVSRVYDDGAEASNAPSFSSSFSVVTALAGDLEKPFLGLSPEAYFSLGATVGTVIHAGAKVSSALPYEALYEVMVSFLVDVCFFFMKLGCG